MKRENENIDSFSNLKILAYVKFLSVLDYEKGQEPGKRPKWRQSPTASMNTKRDLKDEDDTDSDIYYFEKDCIFCKDDTDSDIYYFEKDCIFCKDDTDSDIYYFEEDCIFCSDDDDSDVYYFEENCIFCNNT